jgi:hypothetical protein
MWSKVRLNPLSAVFCRFASDADTFIEAVCDTSVVIVAPWLSKNKLTNFPSLPCEKVGHLDQRRASLNSGVNQYPLNDMGSTHFEIEKKIIADISLVPARRAGSGSSSAFNIARYKLKKTAIKRDRVNTQ